MGAFWDQSTYDQANEIFQKSQHKPWYSWAWTAISSTPMGLYKEVTARRKRRTQEPVIVEPNLESTVNHSPAVHIKFEDFHRFGSYGYIYMSTTKLRSIGYNFKDEYPVYRLKFADRDNFFKVLKVDQANPRFLNEVGAVELTDPALRYFINQERGRLQGRRRRLRRDQIQPPAFRVDARPELSVDNGRRLVESLSPPVSPNLGFVLLPCALAVSYLAHRFLCRRRPKPEHLLPTPSGLCPN